MALGDLVKMSWGDRLKTEGVYCKGYGIIPKVAMLDRDLSLTAKTIYAFLCSLAGNGNSAFPGRETITAKLRLNKETYYNHFKQLTQQGYISVTKQTEPDGKFAHNIYCIENNPKKYSPEDSGLDSGGTLYGTLSMSGIRMAGYGMIPRSVMYDDRLSVKAKGVYAYFASFTGAGKVAFPKLEKILYHLHISKSSYYTYFHELTSLNYIKVVQRHVNGQLDVNDYYFVDKPNESAAIVDGPNSTKKKNVYFTDVKAGSEAKSKTGKGKAHQLPKKPDTGESGAAQGNCQVPKNPDMDKILAAQGLDELPKIPDTEKQDTGKQDEEKQDTEKQDAEIPDAIMTSPLINNPAINKSIYQQSNYPKLESPQAKPQHYISVLMDVMDREEQREFIKSILGYEDFEVIGTPPSINRVNQLIEIVLDAIQKGNPTIKIGGVARKREEVVEQLLSLEYEHYEYVLEAVGHTKSHIKNLKAYYLTALYNAPSTYELFIQRQVEEDDLNMTPEEREQLYRNYNNSAI